MEIKVKCTVEGTVTLHLALRTKESPETVIKKLNKGVYSVSLLDWEVRNTKKGTFIGLLVERQSGYSLKMSNFKSTHSGA